jgi:hypothetical protein
VMQQPDGAGGDPGGGQTADGGENHADRNLLGVIIRRRVTARFGGWFAHGRMGSLCRKEPTMAWSY